jgi:LL-diaminopimelate aminotransferase
MVKRNENLVKLKAGYLFPEINKRRRMFLETHPNARIISLGVGNTTEPLTPHVTSGLKAAACALGTPRGYTGYGDEQGMMGLREKISKTMYGGLVHPDEVFISDGAKCDIGRMQLMFGAKSSVAVQDPSYPVYVDGSVLVGATGQYDEAQRQFGGIQYMRCLPQNGFFPDLASMPRTDLIYFCSPNNPTGAVATRQQLGELVEFARRNRSIILFDAAYSEYISDKGLPKTIFEIDGAKEVAIEISSFSKFIGFTGVRLGWSVVPNELRYDDGTRVINDWNRISTTVFNGASNIAQMGGLAALDPPGMREMKSTIRYYMANAKLIRSALDGLGIQTYGGVNAPYIWAFFPNRKSWDVFEQILQDAQVITTPGSGFGPAGEGFIRFSAFGHRKDVKEAVKRLKNALS